MQPLNFRHLLYFWVVAKEGSITRAAQRLGVAVQTISGQLGQLERDIGRSLFAQQGRRLVLTESGRLALGYADQIFQLGEQLQDALATRSGERAIRLTVGIADAVPKLIAFRLIESALKLPLPVRLVCHEGKFEALLSDLALHKLDAVLADRPVGSGVDLRVFHHVLGESEVTIFAAAELAARCRHAFPACLEVEPMLLPTRNSAIRARLEAWFDTRGIRPKLVAEFDDTALMKTFGRSGLGLFPGPAALMQDMQTQYGVVPVGTIPEIREQYFAISNERRITHPAVEAIRAATAQTIFPSHS
jgi:LysR family transcriptional activator of nhaA